MRSKIISLLALVSFGCSAFGAELADRVSAAGGRWAMPSAAYGYWPGFDDRPSPGTLTEVPGEALGEELSIEGRWEGFGGVPSGCDGIVLDIERDASGLVYLAGEFNACNDVLVNGIAAWAPSTNEFSALGSPPGVDGFIRDIEITSDGDVLVAGSFTRAGNVAASGIARWDGSQWEMISQDVFNGTIADIEIDEANGNIYVGGLFTEITTAGGSVVPANFIGFWDGTTWNAMGDSFLDSVQEMQLIDNLLYAAGVNQQVGSPPSGIAVWDGSQWADVGGGLNDLALSLTSDGERLFVGGFFSSAGGGSAQGVAVWDGIEWLPINGLSCVVRDMDFADGRLFVSGFISSAPPISGAFAVWDGMTWSGPTGIGRSNGFGNAVYADQNEVLLGGDFSVIGASSGSDLPAEGILANRIARYDLSAENWQALGRQVGNGLNGEVSDLAVVGSELWVIGSFTFAGSQYMPGGLARWTGSEWLAFPEMDLPCDSFVDLDVAVTGEVFAATNCSMFDETFWGGTARFESEAWQTLDAGLNGVPAGVTADLITGAMIYYGDFTDTMSPRFPVKSIARWNGSEWSSIGEGDENGLSSSVAFAATVRSAAASDGKIMVSGDFDLAGTTEVDGLALWSGSVWSQPGAGLNLGENTALVASTVASGQSFIAAGEFDRSGKIAVRNIAQWNGSAWAPLEGEAGQGLGASATAMYSTEPYVYVGGGFSEAGGRPANYITRWDGADWYALGSQHANGLRLDNRRSELSSIVELNGIVYAGGRFGGSQTVTSPNLIRFVIDEPVFDDRFEGVATKNDL